MEYQSLVKSAGWEGLVELGKGQLEVRKNLIQEMDVKTQEDIAEFNFAKGEIAAIKLFLTFPDLLIENLKETMQDEYPEEFEDGDGTE